MDKREEYLEVFSIFDTKGDGKIAAAQIGTVLRALGQNPTESELKKYYDPKGDPDKRVSFEEFVPIMNDIAKNPLELRRDDIVTGWRAFDADQNGSIQAATLRTVLTSLGDRLTNEEVDQLLQGVEQEDGSINYEAFTDIILNDKSGF